MVCLGVNENPRNKKMCKNLEILFYFILFMFIMASTLIEGTWLGYPHATHIGSSKADSGSMKNSFLPLLLDRWVMCRKFSLHRKLLCGILIWIICLTILTSNMQLKWGFWNSQKFQSMKNRKKLISF